MDKIAKFNTNPQNAILGLVQYRLLALTYLQVPYRDDHQINKRNKLLKIQYYEQQQWNKLMAIIENEQQKHNDRELRRSNNNQSNASTSTNIDDHKQSNPSFINDTQPTRYTEPLDLNSIANTAQQMKYYDNDSENTIKNRIRRCLNKAKKGQWKKADVHWEICHFDLKITITGKNSKQIVSAQPST